jgi:hypothetical protein
MAAILGGLGDVLGSVGSLGGSLLSSVSGIGSSLLSGLTSISGNSSDDDDDDFYWYLFIGLGCYLLYESFNSRNIIQSGASYAFPEASLAYRYASQYASQYVS